MGRAESRPAAAGEIRKGQFLLTVSKEASLLLLGGLKGRSKKEGVLGQRKGRKGRH